MSSANNTNVDYLGEQGLATAMSLFKAVTDAKADTPGSGNMASANAAGYMSAEDKNKLDGISSPLDAEVLFDSAAGTSVSNSSPSISFTSGKSLASYTDGYLEVYFKQNSGTSGGVNVARTLIHSVSNSVTVEPVQLLAWEYDATNTALSLLACTGSISNGNTLTFSNPENAAFSFTVYRIVGYK